MLMNIIYVLRTESVVSCTTYYTYLLQQLAMHIRDGIDNQLNLFDEYSLWRINSISEDNYPPVNKFIGLQNWLKLQHRITGAICKPINLFTGG